MVAILLSSTSLYPSFPFLFGQDKDEIVSECDSAL